MTLPRRALGATGLTAPIIGFGVSGPHGLGLAATARLVAMMIDADAGLFDTAPFYGDAETRLGAALAGTARDRYLLCTKAGAIKGVAKDFSPAGVVGSLEASLRRLRTEAVDVLLLHGPAPPDLTDDLAATLESLKRRGLTRSVGVCVRGPGSVPSAEWAPIDVIQGPVGESVHGLTWAARAQARGQGFFGIEALRASVSGVRAPRSVADLWYLARAIRSREPPGDGFPVRLRLAQALNQDGVTSIITSTARPVHLAENLAVAAELSA